MKNKVYAIQINRLKPEVLVRIARACMGVEQQEIARMLKISKSYICKVESGERKPNEKILSWAEDTFRIFFGYDMF